MGFLYFYKVRLEQGEIPPGQSDGREFRFGFRVPQYVNIEKRKLLQREKNREEDERYR